MANIFSSKILILRDASSLSTRVLPLIYFDGALANNAYHITAYPINFTILVLYLVSLYFLIILNGIYRPVFVEIMGTITE